MRGYPHGCGADSNCMTTTAQYGPSSVRNVCTNFVESLQTCMERVQPRTRRWRVYITPFCKNIICQVAIRVSYFFTLLKAPPEKLPELGKNCDEVEVEGSHTKICLILIFLFSTLCSNYLINKNGPCYCFWEHPVLFVKYGILLAC